MRQYCEKSNHVIKYLRSGCNAEGVIIQEAGWLKIELEHSFIAVAHLLRPLSVYRLKTWPPAYNIYLLHTAS